MGSSSLVHEPPANPTIRPARADDHGFRRPAERVAAAGGKPPGVSSPSALAATERALPVVLKLPELHSSDRLSAAGTTNLTRPWIGTAMWCGTGVLGVVAAVLLLTGRPESSRPTNEARAGRPARTRCRGPNQQPAVSGVGDAPVGKNRFGACGGIRRLGSFDRSREIFAGPWRLVSLSAQTPPGQPAGPLEYGVPTGIVPGGTAPTGDLPPTGERSFPRGSAAWQPGWSRWLIPGLAAPSIGPNPAAPNPVARIPVALAPAAQAPAGQVPAFCSSRCLRAPMLTRRRCPRRPPTKASTGPTYARPLGPPPPAACGSMVAFTISA